MSGNKIDKTLTIIQYVGYVFNMIAMFVLIGIEINMRANPILIVILAFLYGAYTMLVGILMFYKYLWKSVD